MKWVSMILLGATAFTATNIDDLLFLVVFFANHRFSTAQIVIGHYLGITLLILFGLLGSLLARVVPGYLIGLLGLFPLGLGIKWLVDLSKGQEINEPEPDLKTTRSGNTNAFSNLVTVITVTIANGSDNISVYVPLFARITPGQALTVVIVFIVMVAVWCAGAYFLVNNRFIGDKIRRVGDRIAPWILIGLGIFILSKIFLR